MVITVYIKECWRELWNPNSRAWQYIDRILFILLPIITVISLRIPKGYEEQWGIMLNLAWIIPLSIWLFVLLLLVPYKVASKYKRQWNEACMGKQEIINRYENKPKPNLQMVDKPYVDKRVILNQDGQSTGVCFQAACAKFCNKPRIRSVEADAKGVWGEITFFDLQGNPQCGPIKARWSSKVQPPRRLPQSPKKQYYQTDLDASGLEDEITIAIKHDGDQECYAFNDESYAFSGLKNPNFKLTGKGLNVVVTLQGQNVTETQFCFELHNEGIITLA